MEQTGLETILGASEMKSVKCTYWQRISATTTWTEDGGSITRPIYREVGSNEGNTTWEHLPVGACVIDKHGLMVKLPLDVEWTRFTFFSPECRDSIGGLIWTYTGEPPNINISPSIWFNKPTGWHGFVRDGHVIDA